MSRLPLVRMLALAAAAASMCVPAQARDIKAGAITVSHPWVRTPPPGAPTAAGYLTLVNHGAAAERLLGGSFEPSGRIEVHDMSMNGGIMRMRPVTGGLVIAPGQTVTLSPGGGRHLMLLGARPLKAGDKLAATLRFDKAGPVRVAFAVEEPSAQGAAHDMEKH